MYIIFLQTEAFKKALVIMERVVNLNTYQPKQAAYRGEPVVKGRTLNIIHNDKGQCIQGNGNLPYFAFKLSSERLHFSSAKNLA